MIDPDAEQLRRMSWAISMQLLDDEIAELRRRNRLNRRLTVVLIVCALVNVGAVLLTLT